MNAIIKKIALFKGNDEKRIVDLDAGLNIITGDSKTGKSALIEIVDYCLFASHSTIPKGKITDFADYFSIVLKVKDKFLIIARPSSKNEDSTRAFFHVETTDEFLDNFSFNYFSQSTLRRIKGDVQNEVERHLGLSVADTRLDEDEDRRSAGQASLRNLVTFLFQHQNLIANKHSLFYRFDDTYKRKATIDQLPVFLGWVDGEYYALYRELQEKRKILKAEKSLQKRFAKSSDELRETLYTPINQYYKIIGQTLSRNLSLEELKKLGKNLPVIPLSAYSSRDLEITIGEYANKRLEAQKKLSEVDKTLLKLSENMSDSQAYANKIHAINTTISNDNISELHCPLCNNVANDVNTSVKQAVNSKIKLRYELEKTGVYSVDVSEQMIDLRKERDQLKLLIQQITAEIELLTEREKSFKEGESLRDQAMIMKGLIEATIKQILNNNNLAKSTIDQQEIEDRIKFLETKVEGFNLPAKYKEADVFVATKMNQICQKLDFEEELKPGELQFNTETFEFYYHKSNEKILLSEMGSGANWLACHLSLFIALLHLSCREKKSCIPTILFIDQPSQVYFPKQYKQLDTNEESDLEENIKQVKNIFKVILDEVLLISQECGFTPQVVVMDHAYEEELEPYIKEKWSKEGKKLI